MSRREEFKSRMKEFKQYKDTTGKRYWEWKQSLPDNLKYTDESQYDLKGAYEAGLQPELNQEDGLYHLGSRDPETGRILKRNIHPTYWKALEEDAKIGYDAYWIGNDTYTSRKGDTPIKAFALGGDNGEYGEEDRHTSIVTNTVKKALERGDIQLVQRILKSGKRENKEFYYPDNGSIQSLLNIYDTPLLGDALSLLDALKYSVKGDWDNASLSYIDAASPLALFSRSKLNWKGWGAKKKYIPEYEAIEREAKKNGTWLKNADGTDFTGDPREWVVKRSKKFKEAFGDKYLEGYTGMRSPYNPKESLDTYLSSKERAYTYTPSKKQIKKKGDTGIAKLVVPNTDTYTVDALGNDWLHLTDKSINPYNFTNTNQIVSSVQTPVISFKNIRDDGPFGMRDIAEDQFVAKSTTPRKSVLYNNGDFDLSNSDIFKTTITPYIGYKLYNKANREDIQSYAIGGETEQPDIYTDERTDHPIAVRQNLDRNINVANYIDRINHIDPNIGEYNPFYTASDNTYGTVSLPEVTVTAPWTKQGRNNADARRGMHYVQQGLEDAAKVAAPIVAGAVLPAMASTGALGAITDLASIALNPLDPLNYIPYINNVPRLNSKIINYTSKYSDVDVAPNIYDIISVNNQVEEMKKFYMSDEYRRRLQVAKELTNKTIFSNQFIPYTLSNNLDKGIIVAPRFTKENILGITRWNEPMKKPEIALNRKLSWSDIISTIDHEVAHASLKAGNFIRQYVRHIEPYNKLIAKLRTPEQIYNNLSLKNFDELRAAMNHELYQTDLDEIRSRAYQLVQRAKRQSIDVTQLIDKFTFNDPNVWFGKSGAPSELDDLLKIMSPSDIKHFVNNFLTIIPAAYMLNQVNNTKTEE